MPVPDDGVILRLFQVFSHQTGDLGRCFTYLNAIILERLDLFCCSACGTSNYRTGMTHTLSRRRSLARDETKHGFIEMLFDINSSILFISTTNFADNYNCFCILVVLE